MRKSFRRLALGVLAGVLVIAPSVSAQTTDESGQSYVAPTPVPATAQDPTNPRVDLVFTPIVPCRIIDTRIVGGPIFGGGTRSFVVSGTVGFTGQGGTAGGCGIPLPAAVAAVINYVAVGPQGPGDLRVTPFGTPVPLASILNYAPVSGLNIANGVATKLCTAPSVCNFDITIQADVAATDLVADVLGYYRDVSCQPGTVKVLGQCVETGLRGATDVFTASDNCRALAGGGRLLTGLELRSLLGGNPLTLAAGGEWTDSVYFDSPGTFFAMTIANSGGFAQVGTLSPRQYRCAFRSLP